MIFVLITGMLLAFREGLRARTSQTAFHIPARCRYSWRRFGDWHASLHTAGEEQSPVCLQPLPSNHIITPLKARHPTKAQKVNKVNLGQLFFQLLSHHLSSPGGGQGVCLCKAIILLRWRVPPQLSPRNTKINWLLRKQRAFKWRVTEQT